jgi:hypothetical protein
LFTKRHSGPEKGQIVQWILILSLAASSAATARAQEGPDVEKSCRSFVQSFYDWYMKQPRFTRVLKYRASALSPELFRRLEEDYQAQAKSPADVVGLDFDPILNTQDPDQHYLVGRIKVTGGKNCWAEIHGGAPGKESKEAYVAAELAIDGGRWRFVNFEYATKDSNFSASVASGGLLGLLKELRETRRKAEKTQPGAAPTPQNTVPSPKPPNPTGALTPHNGFSLQLGSP